MAFCFCRFDPQAKNLVRSGHPSSWQMLRSSALQMEEALSLQAAFK